MTIWKCFVYHKRRGVESACSNSWHFSWQASGIRALFDKIHTSCAKGVKIWVLQIVVHVLPYAKILLRDVFVAFIMFIHLLNSQLYPPQAQCEQPLESVYEYIGQRSVAHLCLAAAHSGFRMGTTAIHCTKIYKQRFLMGEWGCTEERADTMGWSVP